MVIIMAGVCFSTWEVHLKFQFPPDRYYDRVNHLWVQLNAKNQQATVGIDALGLETLGDLAYVALPEVGAQIERGKPIGTLEAAKMTSELIAPISGRIVARNEQVLRDPSRVKRDGYGEAWLFTIEPSAWSAESAQLVHGEAVSSWVESEIERYQRQGWIHVS